MFARNMDETQKAVPLGLGDSPRVTGTNTLETQEKLRVPHP